VHFKLPMSMSLRSYFPRVGLLFLVFLFNFLGCSSTSTDKQSDGFSRNELEALDVFFNSIQDESVDVPGESTAKLQATRKGLREELLNGSGFKKLALFTSGKLVNASYSSEQRLVRITGGRVRNASGADENHWRVSICAIAGNVEYEIILNNLQLFTVDRQTGKVVYQALVIE